MLAAQGRSTVPDVIIFETDGQANQPNTMNPCNYFNNAANGAKAAGQTITAGQVIFLNSCGYNLTLLANGRPLARLNPGAQQSFAISSFTPGGATH